MPLLVERKPSRYGRLHVWLAAWAVVLFLLPASDRLLAASHTSSDPPPPADTVELDEHTGYVLPFSYDPPGHPFLVIQVSINKSEPLPFVLDTGAQPSVFLFPWAADKLHLTLDKTKPPRFDHGLSRQMTAEPVNVDLLTIAPGVYVNYKVPAWVGTFPVFENYNTPQAAGIIGLSIFKKLTLRLDFDRKRATIFAGKHPPLKLPGLSATLPMEMPVGGFLRAYVSLPGAKPMPFMIDTGAMSSILPGLEGVKEGFLAKGSASSDDMSGHHIVDQVLLPRLDLGTFSAPLVGCSVDPQYGQPILGMDVLSCFRVTIDARNGFLTLQPRPDAVSHLPALNVVDLEERHGEFFVVRILQAFPPTHLAVGDQLLSIDGTAV